MSNPQTHLDMINAALSIVGGGDIMDESEDTELAAKVVPLYYARLGAILAMHHWSFAGKIYRLDAVPKDTANDYDAAAGKFMNGWHHGFLMPGTRIGLPRKVLYDPRRHDDPLRDFFVEQNVVYADRERIWAQFTVDVAPSVWKPDFTLAVQTLVAADFCVPVSHDKDLAASMRVTGEGTPQEQGRGGLLGRAIGADAAGSRSKSPLWQDPLSSARLG